MIGVYMYVVGAILLFGFLLAKVLLRSRPPGKAHRPLSPITEADIEMAVRKGQKVEAIKLYREMTGCEIKQALDAVEAMTARLHPDP
jgi:ribosomal protein L7/L12